jgi:hypothetical protein
MADDSGSGQQLWGIVVTSFLALFAWALQQVWRTRPDRVEVDQMIKKQVDEFRADDKVLDDARVDPLKNDVKEIKNDLRRMDDKLDRLIERTPLRRPPQGES